MSEKDQRLVVTRHRSLVIWLQNQKIITEETEVITHASIEDVKGRHIIGVLPNWLACHADRITEIQLRLPPEKRNKELTLEDVNFYATKPLKTYKVIRLDGKEKNGNGNGN